MEKSNKKEIVISVIKEVAFLTTCFLAGYGLTALAGDIKDYIKEA